MTKFKKKGFTIVELVIVIAVIAILAAVLIPTFSNIIKRAKKSADVQLAKNLNTVLTMAIAEGRIPQSMYDVLYLSSESGYLIENLNPTLNGFYFVWDSNKQKILYVCSTDGGTLNHVEYPEDYVLTPSDCWITVGSSEEAEMAANAGYNLYLKNSIEKIELHNVAVSIDTGAYSLGSLTIDGDVVDSTSITLVGNFGGDTNISASNVSFTTTGTISSLTIGSNVVSANLGSTVGSLSTAINNTNIGTTGLVQSVNSESTGTITINNGTTTVDPTTISTNGISGAENGIVSIGTKEAIDNIRTQIVGGRSFKGETIQLSNDVNMAGIAFQPMSNFDRVHKSANDLKYWFQGSFDGNNCSIDNLQIGDNLFSIGTLNAGTNDSSCKFGVNQVTYKEANYGLLGTVYATKDNPVVIKNLTINANIDLIKNDAYNYVGDSVAALIGFAYGEGTITIENVTVNGIVKSYDGCAAFIGRAYGESSTKKLDIEFINCINNAEITGVRKVGAFVGSGAKSYPYEGNNARITYSNCINNGNIICLDGNTYDGIDLKSTYEMAELASSGNSLGIDYMKAGCAAWSDGNVAPSGFTNNGTIIGNR